MSSPAKIEESSPALPENGKAGGRQEKKKLKVHFDNKIALQIFQTLGTWWREKRGFYSSLTPPQRVWLPKEAITDAIRLGHWLFFMAIPMRGGINSNEAFRFVYELYLDRPDLFDPRVVKDLPPREIHLAAKNLAKRFHDGGSKGDKEEGTFSMNSAELTKIWVRNARVLVEKWGGDIRNIFWGVTEFEEAFRRIDYRRNPGAGFRGMRRKIFSLLCMWFQEFGLIQEFPLPLIIDFHSMRYFLEVGIIKAQFAQLGAGNARRKERLRPESMWRHQALKVNEVLVNKVIMWSQPFLLRHGLVQYDVAHAIWFLSRELCKNYYGNRSFEKKVGEKSRSVTEQLISDSDLEYASTWPPNYRDLCQLCPTESFCKLRIPAGPYFDWRVLVRAGKHLHFPGRQEKFSGVSWREMSGSFKKPKKVDPILLNGNGNGKVENCKAHEALQLPFYED